MLVAVADDGRGALEELYARHAPWLTLRLTRRCGDHDGTPAAMTEMAKGRVWRAAEGDASARLSWRTGDVHHRLIGDPPRAKLEQPTLEDAYLLLIGRAPDATVAMAGA